MVVNLERSTDRWAHIQENFKPWVRSVVRSPGFPKEALQPSEVQTFMERGRATMASSPELQINDQTSMNFWRGSLAILKAFTTAIEIGAMTYDRFIMAEDDAMVNKISIRKAVAPPLSNGSVNIWGGALVGGSYAAHFKRAVALDSNTWSQIQPDDVARRVSATAVEIDSNIAEQWLDIIWDKCLAYDMGWWWAMREIPCWVPDAEIIPQNLELNSIRMPASSGLRAKTGRRFKEQGLIV